MMKAGEGHHQPSKCDTLRRLGQIQSRGGKGRGGFQVTISNLGNRSMVTCKMVSYTVRLQGERGQGRRLELQPQDQPSQGRSKL